MFRKAPQDTLPPVDDSNDFRSLEIGDKARYWVGSIVGAGVLVATSYSAHQSDVDLARNITNAHNNVVATRQAEAEHRGGVDLECGRLILSYRSDLVSQPDKSIRAVVESGLCGKEGPTIAKVASNLAIATTEAEKTLAKSQEESTNNAAFALGGLLIGSVAGGISGHATSFGVFCVMDGISDRKKRKYYEKFPIMHPGADWKPPIQDRL